jgi:hypothetical protein
MKNIQHLVAELAHGDKKDINGNVALDASRLITL